MFYASEISRSHRWSILTVLICFDFNFSFTAFSETAAHSAKLLFFQTNGQFWNHGVMFVQNCRKLTVVKVWSSQNIQNALFPKGCTFMLKCTCPPKEDMIFFYHSQPTHIMKNKPYSKTTTMKGGNYKIQFSTLNS